MSASTSQSANSRSFDNSSVAKNQPFDRLQTVLRFFRCLFPRPPRLIVSSVIRRFLASYKPLDEQQLPCYETIASRGMPA